MTEEPCPDCDGTGFQMDIHAPICPTCGGSGKKPQDKDEDNAKTNP